MKSRTSTAIIFILFILAVAAGGAGGDLLISHTAVFKTLSRPGVVFPHEGHYGWGIGCLDCHHRYDNGVNILNENDLQPGTPAVSCVSCHRSARELERSYHRMCIGCHTDMKKKGIVAGPVMCGQCHIKRGD